MAVKKYRQRPIQITAVRFMKGVSHDAVRDFCPHIRIYPHDVYLRTPEGSRTVEYGDYIVKGPTGEFTLVKTAAFVQTYEEVGV